MSRAAVMHELKVNSAIKKLMTTLDKADVSEIVNAIDIKVRLADFTQTSANHHRLDAGRMLIALRARIEGDGDNWWEWHSDHFARSRRDTEKLIALASADDPVTAQIEHAQKHRAGQAAYRKRLTVSRSNPINNILELIEALTDKERHALWKACREKWPW